MSDEELREIVSKLPGGTATVHALKNTVLEALIQVHDRTRRETLEWALQQALLADPEWFNYVRFAAAVQQELAAGKGSR